MEKPEVVLEFKDYRQYTWSFIPITDRDFLGQQNNLFCNHIIIKNLGTADIIINNTYVLKSYETLQLPGYPGEIGRHNLEFTFDVIPGNVKKGVIICKNYPNV